VAGAPTLVQLAENVRRRIAGRRRVVFVSGNFNVVHPGHVRLLRFARECGDCLVVGVNSQSTEGALLSEHDRLDGVRSISYVDHAFVLTGKPEAFVEVLQPAVVVKGKEYEGRSNPEASVLAKYGGRLLFGSGEVSFSSLDLLRREIREVDHSTIDKPHEFRDRHRFTLTDLRAVLRKFEGMRIVVIGDLIVDEYVNCEALGMSQEEPSLVVAPIASDRFVGGSGIVAAHARSLGGRIDYFTVAGNDEARQFAAAELEKGGVKAHIFVDESRPTTVKQRFRAGGRSLLRVSHLRQHAISNDLVAQVLEGIRPVIADADLLVFSDFNYGCLPQPLVDSIVTLGAAKELAMVADSQSSSQIGDISRYRSMLLVTPTEREARLATRDFSSGLVVMAEDLQRRCGAENLVLTLGAEGLLVQRGKVSPGELVTDRLPAFNLSPRDTAGAGDSFLACASMALVSGADIWRSVYLGSLAAACQVGRVGNVPLAPADLIAELDED
jgi:rfaE bifunctional protein kinase chain/domain